VADFTLPDVHRRPRSLDGFKDKKAFVVVFLGTECPLANLYVPTLIDLHKAYAGKGVQFLAVNANAQDGFTAVAAHAQEREVPFPVLKDYDRRAADALGARRTPEAFLLDAGRGIRYHGRIDDQYGIGYRRAEPRRRDLKEALDELLAGKPVSTPATEVSGCLIGRATEPAVAGEVTYARQVSRLLQKRCQECHRPGESGPMALLTYDDARSWADTIREVVLEERMPPWYADPRFGHFANDRRLSPEEADLLLAWVKQGCPKGDDKDLPPPAKFPRGWRVGEPDAVYRMGEEFKVPAKGVLPYKQFLVDPQFKEDRWVQAAEARPGNRAVVHHILVYILAPGKRLYDSDGTAATLVGWAPGDMPAVYPRGTAKRIPAGSRLLFEVHYTPNGKEQTDRSSVGVVFAREPPEYVVETNILANVRLRIPPRAADHREEFRYTFREDARLYSFMPHMHLRGARARYEVAYPDGRTQTLLSVPDYDFNWQSVYRFAEPIPVPRGAKITFVAHWDNSADNPRNPDPNQEVRYGLQTWEEMMNGWMEVVRKRRPK
jgi:mono/diheme cytochrome c family protein